MTDQDREALPPLPEPEIREVVGAWIATGSDRPYEVDGYTASQMRAVQKQMARECWKVLKGMDWMVHAIDVLEERFGPFDE